ncbi:MAG TPA: SMP-30/gluconolactonase/LRE family protein [Chitinispirillaceae bacterium]|nr:SMP-30/gluconolactonase/LRE family protein [Chitinispirillaceae bacterium]
MMKNIISHFFIPVLLFSSVIYSQNLGTVNLPASLADPGTQIINMVPVKPQNIGYCEGPVVDNNGNLYFSEQDAGIIWKVTSSGQVSKWLTLNPPYVNGLDIAPSGNIAVCEKTRITERDFDGNLVRVVTTGNNWGQGANDLTYASNGDMFFTAFNQYFWFHSADSSVNHEYSFSQPFNIYFNGIEFLEEKNILYVCQWGQNRVMKYTVNINREVNTNNGVVFANIAGPDGITVDKNYNVYIASNSASTGGIYVYDSTGNQLGNILMRQDNNPGSNASNCVFGGPDNKTLYITGDGGAYKVQLKVAGRVRPVITSLKQDRRLSALQSRGPELSINRRGKGIELKFSEESVANGSIFTASGKKLLDFQISKSVPLYWEPPVRGVFAVHCSKGRTPFSRTITFE